MDKGKRIRSAREACGMTQSELGAACGTGKQTIFKYENGLITNIPLDRIEKIAAATGVTPAYIMGWEPTPETLGIDFGNTYTQLGNTRFEHSLGVTNIASALMKEASTPVSESGRNVLRIAGRDGTYVERTLTDEQLAAIKMMVDQLPDADDDL